MSFFLHRLLAGDTAGIPQVDSPLVSALDRGFQLGDGVFDTMSCFKGRPFAQERHRARLVRHAAAIGIDVDPARLEEALGGVLNDLGERHAILRTTVTRGQAARGLWPPPGSQSPSNPPTILVTAQPWSTGLVGQPAHLAEAELPRNQFSPLARLKSLNYLENILAARRAAEAGADDALIRNLEGNAVSSTIANLFAIIDGRFVTPPCADGCLDGVMRALVLEEAEVLGFETAEASLTPALMERAQALFLTNSVRLIRPVSALGKRSMAPSPRAASSINRLFNALLARIEHDTGARLEVALPIQ
ncbi:class IV aminotransferase [Labrys okinawensis]|uniref:Probable branched-chain-amino-acid aminotransferase n=1 Tax=Labrys okinawensis TaxID=346911 RepID=A0A2S9QAR1_9HYPH|nr:aminotransferase class IV [Labrys okinawensis]PRH86437.1 class IV aminotransferase [Labrys okinawensis]